MKNNWDNVNILWILLELLFLLVESLDVKGLLYRKFSVALSLVLLKPLDKQ